MNNSIAVRFEAKFAPEAAAGTFTGYGAVFGNLDLLGDTIQKGAFRDSLREWKAAKALPPMLLQHGGWGMGTDDLMPVGIWTAMTEDETGLHVEGRLALETTRGRDAHALLKMEPRPALDGLSIGYRPKVWEMGTKPEEPRRTLKKIDLIEVSLVTFPANGKARIEAVKAADEIQTIREFEMFLRDAGYSTAAARAIAARGYKGKAEPRDEDAGALLRAQQARIRNLRP